MRWLESDGLLCFLGLGSGGRRLGEVVLGLVGVGWWVRFFYFKVGIFRFGVSMVGSKMVRFGDGFYFSGILFS